jgi:hypothetical protein
MTVDRVSLFRVGSAFTLLGVSLVCFLLGGLAKEKSNRLFSLMHSFGAGVLLGMGFLFADPDGIADINGETFHNAVYISSISFIALIALEQFNLPPEYDYTAIVTGDDVYDEEDDYKRSQNQRSIELSTIENGDEFIGSNNSSQLDEDRPRFLNGKDSSIDEQLALSLSVSKEKSFRFHPFILLFTASLSNMLGAVHLSCEEHPSIGLFAVVASHKALMAASFGALLEASTAPRELFVFFMLTFSFSSFVGTIAGTAASSFGWVPTRRLHTIRSVDMFVTALTAGVYLYIATMKMVPAGVLTPTNKASVAARSDNRCSENVDKFVSFLGGFLCTVVPKLFLVYYSHL